MARQNFMTMAVSESVQDVFNDFVAEKNLTKTAALNDMLELYMLASDEELYLRLKKKHLHVDQVRDLLADRAAEMERADYLFIKLGQSETADGEVLDGEGTIQLYMDDEAQNGYTWFSTQSLFFGMSAARVKQYNEKIQKEGNVRMLFAMNTKGVDNDIAFSARVLELQSAKLPAPCPDGDRYPDAFRGEQARIWIKLSDIRAETAVTASMLKITSTGRDLKQTISNSQYHFGYVSLK